MIAILEGQSDKTKVEKPPGKMVKALAKWNAAPIFGPVFFTLTAV